MDDYESLSHMKWECKYHVVSIPKCDGTRYTSALGKGDPVGFE
jgi:REP element-mobilizing transposase RayT